MKWVVQKLVGSPRAPQWQDVSTDDGYARAEPWEAEDAGQAFRLAVLDNPGHKIQGVSYRVLPFTGGVTFHVALNLDAEDHGGDAR